MHYIHFIGVSNMFKYFKLMLHPINWIKYKSLSIAYKVQNYEHQNGTIL